MKNRIVEIYAGAYASGKSETALNRALQYANRQDNISLVDLDTVEPVYTLRPIAKKLKTYGVNVITQPEYFGLGETGSYITAAQMNCLSMDGNIIIDVGYGAAGLDILDIIPGIDNEKNCFIYLVVNTAKFETSNTENIIEYTAFSTGIEKRPWKKFDGFISNTHFGNETTLKDVLSGYKILKEASETLNIPIRAIGVDERIAGDIDNKYDGVDVWKYKCMMYDAFW